MRAWLAAALVSSSAWAGNFDGTWKMNPASAKTEALTTFSIQDGKLTCSTCNPKYTILADGKPHAVKGSVYSDQTIVRLVSDNVVEFERLKGGKVVSTSKNTISDDGKTLTTEWNYTSPSGQISSGKYDAERVGAAPASGNRLAGTWKAGKFQSANDNALVFTLKAVEGGMEASQLTGESYSAKFDGKKYPYKGDPGLTHVKLKKIDDNTFEETDLRKEKVVSVARYTLGADGKTLQIDWENKLESAKGTWTADKQ